MLFSPSFLLKSRGSSHESQPSISRSRLITRDSRPPSRHPLRRLTSERPSQFSQQPHREIVPVRRGDQGDVHTMDLLDPVEVDFRKDHLLLDAEGVVAPAIEAPAGEPPEIPDPGNGQVDEAVEELVHASASQRDRGTDRHSSPKTEVCNSRP